MEGIPWFSTFTLFTEVLVTIGVFTVFYTAYTKNVFRTKLAAVVLGYETLFNISYMTYRALTHEEPAGHTDSAFHIAVAVFHGTFSLLMFIVLVIFMFIAWRKYEQGVNFFQEHKRLTAVFIVSWIIAICSGFLFYYEAYFSPEELALRNEAQRVIEQER